MKNYLAFLLLFLAGGTEAITGDSTRYLLPEDTIFLKIGKYQHKIFEHEIEKGQTLYSLAKFYGLSIDELYLYNPQLLDRVLSPYEKVSIPIPNRAIIRYTKADFQREQYVPIYYVVRKGDTFFSISTRLFKMPMDTIALRNNLTSATLSIGQSLFVGWMDINGIPESFRKFRGDPQWQGGQQLRGRYVKDKARHPERERVEQGVAFWQKNSGMASDLYALHRRAPLNSVIAVTNPMNKRRVYAKVIGRIPENVYGSDVVVVISPTVAKFLGAKDPRFLVKLRYLR
ncbi:MAG: LysM peptidoglycan-binding domain-containing protein [Bacteroidota bacterium]